MAGGSVQYAIDVAATMSGGEYTSKQLDDLTANLTGAGKGAEHFQQAIQRVSDELSAAKSAALAAKDALADGNREYKILETAADQAAKAADRAWARGDRGAAMLEARALEAKRAVDDYATTLRGLEDASGKASAKEEHLAQTLGNVRRISTHVDKTLSGQSETLGKLQGSVNAVGGPLGRIGNALLAPVKGFSELSASLGASRAAALLGAVAFAAVAAAVVALTVALVTGAADAAAWSVKLGDVARSADLSREAQEQVTTELVTLRGEIQALEEDTGQSAESLRGFAKDLVDAKVEANDLPAALRGIALAETALGKGGSKEFIKKIKEGRLAVDDFALDMQDKFGNIVARQMLGLEAQSARFGRVLGATFGGIDIEPALFGMATLIDLFDQTQVSGDAMKFMFEELFGPIIGRAEDAAQLITAFVLGFEIGLTKIYIAMRPAINAVKEFFGFDDTSLADTCAAVTKVAEFLAFAFVAVGVVFGTAVVLIGGVVAALVGLQVALATLVVAASYGAAQLWAGFADRVSDLVEFLRSVVAVVTGIGSQLMQGLANGIRNSAGAVVDAITGAVQGAIAAAKRMLGIASPSKVFAGIGEFTGQGFVEGVEDQQTDAERALTQMVAPPEVPRAALDSMTRSASAPASAPATSTTSTTSSSLNLAGATFNFYGVAGAEDSQTRFGELLTRLLEGDAAELGAEAAPA